MLSLKSVQERLRDHESSKYNISSMVASAVASGGSTTNEKTTHKRPSMSNVKFEDDSALMDVKSSLSIFEKPPSAMTRVPYWQMR